MAPGPRGSLRFLGALLALAAGHRILLAVSLPAPAPETLFADARLFHDWAAAAARREDFVGRHPYWLPPGYPLCLSLLYRIVGPRPSAVLLLQAACGLLTISLVYALGRRLYGDRVGFLAGALAILYAPFSFFEGKFLSVSLLTPLLLSSLLVLVHPRPKTASSALAGLCGGIAAVLHPASLLPVGALALSLTLGPGSARARIGRAALFGLAALLPILPVTARNRRASGQLVLVSANGGANLYLGNGPRAGATFRSPGPEWGSIFEQRDAAIRTASEIAGRAVNEAEASRVLAASALRWVASDPSEALGLLVAKGAGLLSSFEFDPLHGLAAERTLEPVHRLAFLPFAVLLALAAAGISLARPANPAATRLAAFLAGHAAVALAFFSYSRFRLPAVAAMLPVAAAGAIGIARELRARSLRPVPAALFVAALLASLVPLPTEKRAALARGLASVGFSALAVGDLERAERALDGAIRASPTSVAARLGLARVARARGRDRAALEWIETPAGAIGESWLPLLLERGTLRAASLDPSVRDIDAAEGDFRRALVLDPSNEAALYGLGGVAYERAKARAPGDPGRSRDLSEAEAWFRRLVEVHPNSLAGWKGLAEALRGLGRAEEAERAERRRRDLDLRGRG